MTQFQCDTSGVFHIMPGHPLHRFMAVNQITWPDLSPFVQGYVEAMLRDAVKAFMLTCQLGEDDDGDWWLWPPQGVTIFSVPDEGWLVTDDFMAGRSYSVRADVEAACTDYIAALFAFANLAAETLARIMEDCERFQAMHAWKCYAEIHPWGDPGLFDPERAGMAFWHSRNEHTQAAYGFGGGSWPKPYGQRLMEAAETFPPLTVYLGDDGKVYLREAGR